VFSGARGAPSGHPRGAAAPPGREGGQRGGGGRKEKGAGSGATRKAGEDAGEEEEARREDREGAAGEGEGETRAGQRESQVSIAWPNAVPFRLSNPDTQWLYVLPFVLGLLSPSGESANRAPH